MADTTTHRTATVHRAGDDAGKLVLRVTVAALILLHGIAKISGGVSGIAGMLQGVGMPGVLAYGVYIGEVVAPILVIIGLWTRVGALLMVVNMIVAVLLVHTHELFMLTKTGGWAIELQALFLLGSVAIALLGAGRYSVGGVHGRWN